MALLRRIPEVDARAAADRLADGAVALDVRELDEWEAGRIAGARHLPLDALAERAGEIDRERPVVVYCRGGNRSSMATAALADAGYDAVKLSEGIVGWVEDELPVEPDDGYVAESGEAAAVLQARKRAV